LVAFSGLVGLDVSIGETVGDPVGVVSGKGCSVGEAVTADGGFVGAIVGLDETSIEVGAGVGVGVGVGDGVCVEHPPFELESP
jgi:hypothetical protein